ncbi:MAG: type II secretion system protein [bacterium]|nr:type II secretion system protein [bacterium]
MSRKRHTTRGFTLIELLVVVAIIGLLSSIVLASLRTARANARDSAIKEEVGQLRILMELNRSDYGSYSNLSLNSGWIRGTYATCAAYPVLGTYAAQFRSICTSIMSKEAGAPVNTFYSGVSGSVTGANTVTYSILVWLPGAQTYWCAGSSGAVSTDPGSWLSAGCWLNP